MGGRVVCGRMPVLRSPAGKQRTAGDEASAAVEGQVSPRPGKKDGQAIAKAHQEEQVDGYPGEPGQGSLTNGP